MLAEKQVPYFPLDVLMSSVKQIEYLEIKSSEGFIKKSNQLWKHNITKKMIEHLGLFEKNYLIEGEVILPIHINEFKEEFPDIQMKVCFIGYTQITPEEKLKLVRTYNTGIDDWTVKNSDEKMLEHVTNTVEFSKYLKEECEKYNLPFFDVSENFKETHEEIFKFLTKKTG